MTEREIRETIEAIRTEQRFKDVLLQRALAGDREALFVVAAKRKHQAASKKLSEDRQASPWLA